MTTEKYSYIFASLRTANISENREKSFQARHQKCPLDVWPLHESRCPGFASALRPEEICCASPAVVFRKTVARSSSLRKILCHPAVLVCASNCACNQFVPIASESHLALTRKDRSRHHPAKTAIAAVSSAVVEARKFMLSPRPSRTLAGSGITRSSR